jgi:hypothetical protein
LVVGSLAAAAEFVVSGVLSAAGFAGAASALADVVAVVSALVDADDDVSVVVPDVEVVATGRTGVVSGVLVLALFSVGAGVDPDVAALVAGAVSAVAAGCAGVLGTSMFEEASFEAVALDVVEPCIDALDIDALAPDAFDADMLDVEALDAVSPVDTASPVDTLTGSAAVDDALGATGAAVRLAAGAAPLSATLTSVALLSAAVLSAFALVLVSIVLETRFSALDFVVFLLDTGFCLELPGALRCKGLLLPSIAENGVKPGATAGAGWAAAGRLPGLKLAFGLLVG